MEEPQPATEPTPENPVAAPSRGLGRALAAGALFVSAAVGLVAHMRVFNFVTDDAFISFVYSRNLVRHGELVFNLGERVEGYTNFLWTVFLALWMKLGWQPESSSIVWGCVFAIGTMLTCAYAISRARGNRRPSPWDALPALVLAAWSGYACWSSGGLETQMFTFFVTVGSVLYLKELEAPRPGFSSAAVFGLAALTRPEGNLFFAIAGLHRVLVMWRARRFLPSLRRHENRNESLVRRLSKWVRNVSWLRRHENRNESLVRRLSKWVRNVSWLRELTWVSVYLAVVMPHFLWRHRYYGWWLPNTFYIKSSGGEGTFGRGLYYLRRFAEQHAVWAMVLLVLGGWLTARDKGVRRFLGFASLAVVVFYLYVASVGGDFMGLFRFALPAVPLLVVAAVLGLRALCEPLARRWTAAPALVSTALLGLFVWHAVAVDKAALVIGADQGIDSPGFLRRYTANRAAIGKWFGRYVKPDDYAVVGGAGAQVYYSGIRSLDGFGLSDEYIAHQVPPVSNRPGHQKYAPLDYQLKEHCFKGAQPPCIRPTIITSTYYRIGGAPYLGPDEGEWRGRGYHYVNVEVPGMKMEGPGLTDAQEPPAPWYTFIKRMDRALGPLPAVNGDID